MKERVELEIKTIKDAIAKFGYLHIDEVKGKELLEIIEGLYCDSVYTIVKNLYKDDVEQYNGYIDGYIHEINTLRSKLKALEEKLRIAEEALEYYADDNNWYTADTDFHTYTYLKDEDDGDTAKRALSKIRGE